MQHIQKPGKHGKSWFISFSRYSLYFQVMHFSKRYVCLSHSSQSIDQNYQCQCFNEAYKEFLLFLKPKWQIDTKSVTFEQFSNNGNCK